VIASLMNRFLAWITPEVACPCGDDGACCEEVES